MVCANPNYAAPCQTVATPSDICTNLPADFDHTVASFRPDQSATCTLFEYVNL